MKSRPLFLLATLYLLLATSVFSQTPYRGPIFHNRVAKTSAYTVTAADRELLLDATTGTWSLSLTASATLGNGFSFGVFNSGSGVITIDPAGVETIRDAAGSAATKTLAQGEGGIVFSDGTGWGFLKVTTGGGTPAGSSGDIQYNNGGAFGGITPTGTGAVVRAISPTLVTPALGTPSAVNLANASGLPVSTGISGFGSGIADALAINTGAAGAPLLNGGSLTTNALLKATSSTTAGNSLLSDNGTTLTYTGTGGFTASGPITASGSGSGALVLPQGPSQSTGTNNIILQAPTSVTSYLRTLEGSAGSTGLYLGTVSGTTVTDSKLASGASGNVLVSNGTTWLSSGASSIAIADSGGNFPTDNVEAAFATMAGRVTREIGVGFDGGGSVLTAKSIQRACPNGFTIVSWQIVGDQSGSITIDILKGTPSGGSVSYSSITASAKPALSSAAAASSSTLTGWTTSVAAGDVLKFTTSGISTLTQVNLALKIVPN